MCRQGRFFSGPNVIGFIVIGFIVIGFIVIGFILLGKSKGLCVKPAFARNFSL